MDTRARHAPLGKNLTGVKDRACRRGYCIGGPDYAPEPLWPTMSKLLSQEAVRTGIMVAMRLEGPILCPFFACCDGVVVFSADGAIETFPAGQAYGARAIYDVIDECGVERLICGFIAVPCRYLLRSPRLDISLGPCPAAIATPAAPSHTPPPSEALRDRTVRVSTR